MSQATATTDPTDADRLAEIELDWERYRKDYADDPETGALDNLPVGKISAQMEFLIDLAKRSGRVREEDRGRLRDIDREWREFRLFNNRDISADRRVPVAVGKLMRTVAFLAAVAKGEPTAAEPRRVREEPALARGPASGPRGAGWE